MGGLELAIFGVLCQDVSWLAIVWSVLVNRSPRDRSCITGKVIDQSVAHAEM